MKVAKTYQNWNFDFNKAFEENGKSYVIASNKCDRCINGVYVSRVENNMPVPHPEYNGICLQCNGTGTISKKIRVYTDKEFENMEKANEKASEKKAKELEERLQKEYTKNKEDWLEQYGFNEVSTFVYFPDDSYSVKEELKEVGFKFNPNLFWHIAEVPSGYEDKVVEIAIDELVEFSAWGKGTFYKETKEKVEKCMKACRPVVVSCSEWVGEVKEKVNVIAKLIDIRPIYTQYGYSQIVKFETENGDILKWFTATEIPAEIGEIINLTGTIKDLIEDKYENNAKVTLVTRCKIKEV